MKVLVCGGRTFSDREKLYDYLDSFNNEEGITQLIHGAAPGADTLASVWAYRNNVPQIICAAQWTKYGRGAGLRRNEFMLNTHHPEVVIAFPGGRGTAHMKMIARKAKVPVIEVS